MKWSSGWGAACGPCAKAKIRCIRSQESIDLKCNRCQSLNIACPPQDRKPRKKRVGHNASKLREPTSYSRGIGVDRQTNSVDAPLRNGQPNPTSEPDAAARDSQYSRNVLPSNDAHIEKPKPESSRAFSASTTLPGFHPYPTPTCTCITNADGEHDSQPAQSEEALLSIYRTRLGPQFPFVIVSEGTTAADLHRDRPLLMKAILMVAAVRNRRSMWKQSKLLIANITEAIFISSDRPLDLLQAIIVFLGFYHYFCFAHGHFNTLAHMASSLLADLKLDMPRSRPVSKNRQIQGLDPEQPHAMTHDEERAILAVWYLNSSYAVAFKKVNSPHRHFTQHMEQQLRALEAQPEYDTDEVLVQLVYSQRVNEMIAQLQFGHQFIDQTASVGALMADLDKLLARLNAQEQQDHKMMHRRYLATSHQKSAILQLLEPQLLDRRHDYDIAMVAHLRNTPTYFRDQSITSGRQAGDIALRAWFEDWLSIPVCHFFYMPMSGYLHLTNATVVLLRRARCALLASLHKQHSHLYSGAGVGLVDVTSCSMGDVGDTEDLMLDLLEHLATRFEQARAEMEAAHCSEWRNDLLDMIAWKLKERKACIEKWAKIIFKVVQRTQGGEPHLGHGRYGFDEENEADDLFAIPHTSEPLESWLDPIEAFLMENSDNFDSWI